MISLVTSATISLSLHAPAWEFVRELRDAGVGCVSGFHTPLERECLELLLRGTQPITIVPARTFRLGQWLHSGDLWSSIKHGIERGNVTIVSPPGMVGNRVTRANAVVRNRYLLEMGHPLLILAAPPESKTHALALEGLALGLPVFALPHKGHQALFDAGAQVATIEAILAVAHQTDVPDAYSE